MQPSGISELNPLQRWVNRSPFLLGTGVSAYFLMPFEPSGLWAFALLACVMLLWVMRHRLSALAAMLAVSCVVLGFSGAIWQTQRVKAPVLEKSLMGANVEGRVRGIIIDGKRQKVTLDEVKIEGLKPEETPHVIRISTALGSQEIGIGQRIALRAGLGPPARPVLPGGFDFARYFYFRQIGAIGFALPPLTVLPPEITEEQSLDDQLSDWMARQRLALKRYLIETLPEPAAGLSVAYVTGDQSAVSEPLQQAMRAAGLSHILAISGMHLTIVCGMLYFTVRLLLACFPAISRRCDIRKPAALLALISGGLYLWLADYPVSAVRSYVMIAVFFTAILAGREADGLRSLALSAVLILLAAPSSLLEPGFQLSYAAVLALILYYRWWTARRDREAWEEASWVRRMLSYFLGVGVTSLVAGAATAPIAAYHFHQFASYGLLANMICIPLVSFIVTPALSIGLLLVPLGAQEVAMDIVRWGFQTMVFIAEHAANLPGALLNVPPIAEWGACLMVIGAMILLLPRMYGRIAGVMLLLCGLASAHFYVAPDMLISSDAKAIALKENGEWKLLKGTKRNFAVREWQVALDVEMTPGLLERCDRTGCLQPIGSTLLAMPRYMRALAEDCLMADLVIYPARMVQPCNAVHLDGAILQRYGTHALYFSRDDIKMENGCSGQGKRPWNRC